MKFIKTFEDREKSNRNTTYKYLNKDHTDKIREFAKNYIDRLNIFDKIGSLNIFDYEINIFDYFSIFESFFTNSTYGVNSNNIYYNADIYCIKNNITSGPALRNSLGNIIIEIYKEYYKNELKNKLDEKLISLLEAKPNKYKSIFITHEKDMNDDVKKACEWMLTTKKYNL